MNSASLRKVLIELERAGLRTEAVVIEELFSSLEERSEVEEVLRQILVGAEEIATRQEALQASITELLHLARTKAAKEEVVVLREEHAHERFKLKLEKLWAPGVAALISLLTGLAAGAFMRSESVQVEDIQGQEAP